MPLCGVVVGGAQVWNMVGAGGVWAECIKWQETGGKVRFLCLCHMTCRGYESDKAVIQVKYVTHNPAAPAVFYQCADVGIAK